MKKKIYLIISISFTLCLLFAGTYAHWTWSSTTNKDVVFNTSAGISPYITYDAGLSYFVGNFQPTSSFCDSTNTTISFYKSDEIADTPLTATINLTINEIGDNTSSSSDVYWVIIEGDSSNCSSLSSALAYGSLFGVAAGDAISMKTVDVNTTETKYTIYLWIDSSGTSLEDLSGEQIDANIWTQIDMVEE